MSIPGGYARAEACSWFHSRTHRPTALAHRAGRGRLRRVPACAGLVPILSGRETAALRRQAAVLFIDVLLIAYPLAILASILGTVVLVCFAGAGAFPSNACRRTGFVEKSIAGAPAPALRVDLLSLAAFEAGAAAWRLKLHQSPDLSAACRRAGRCAKATRVFRTKLRPDLPALSERTASGAAGSARLCEFW